MFIILGKEPLQNNNEKDNSIVTTVLLPKAMRKRDSEDFRQDWQALRSAFLAYENLIKVIGG